MDGEVQLHVGQPLRLLIHPTVMNETTAIVLDLPDLFLNAHI